MTLRSLVVMVRAKQREEWNRLRILLVKIHNCHCTEPIGLSDIPNPFDVEKEVGDIRTIKHYFRSKKSD